VHAGLRRSRETPQPRQVGQLQSPSFLLPAHVATVLWLCSVNFFAIGPAAYDFTLRLLNCMHHPHPGMSTRSRSTRCRNDARPCRMRWTGCRQSWRTAGRTPRHGWRRWWQSSPRYACIERGWRIVSDCWCDTLRSACIQQRYVRWWGFLKYGKRF
jgi:hypothetical protein